MKKSVLEEVPRLFPLIERGDILVELYKHQIEAINKLRNGSILVGGVGTGKSRTAIAYYYLTCGGSLNVNGKGTTKPPKEHRDLYIITTAKKRDSKEWLEECVPFLIFEDPKKSIGDISLTVDSWNNIKKYRKVTGAFFIFDEQRVVGYGAWTKSFLDITRKNKWILLSATPGDIWMDYCPVFIANGFYKNKTEFISRHVVYDRFAKYPKISRYVDTGHLMELRHAIEVQMYYEKQTVPHHIYVPAGYDKEKYNKILKDRWDPYKNEPIQESGNLCYLLRRVVNEDLSRIGEVLKILDSHHRVIIFYNFNYELALLRDMCLTIQIPFAEWNGQNHEEIPATNEWVYLVQYNAGAEGWNCVITDTMIFYSQNYSYRQTVQAEGRIDRLNTKYKELYYYHIRSTASIDLAIANALKNKKNFNERGFIRF